MLDDSIKCRLYIGGGATLKFPSRSVNIEQKRDTIRIEPKELNEGNILGSYIQFMVDNKNHVEHPTAQEGYEFFRKLITGDQKKLIEEKTGLSLAELDDFYRPYLQESGSRIRLHFPENGDVYYEELKVGKDNGLLELLVGKSMENPEKILNNIHPAIKLEVLEREGEEGYMAPKDRQVVISAIPSGKYPEVSEQYMRHQYIALGIPDENINIIHEKTPPADMLNLLEKADLIEFSGGDQSRVIDTLDKSVIDCIKKKAKDKNVAIITTSASSAMLGERMFIDGASDDKVDNPFLIGQAKTDARLWVGKGIGILPDYIIDTHQRIYPEEVTEDGIGRPRQHRLLAAACLANSDEHSKQVYGFDSDKRVKGISVAEGTFILFSGNELRVIGNQDKIGGVLILDPENFSDVSIVFRGRGVYELTGVAAKLLDDDTKIQLINKPVNGKVRSKITTNPNDTSRYNLMDGIQVLERGDIMNLETGEVVRAKEADKWQNSLSAKVANNDERLFR
ncbi:MAG: Type 1 glutamine amidotransferase-like domain-containing protein [Pseudomonadota bacterium]